MIIVNTPHNPVGKVFTKSELESIAAIAEEFNLLVMSDEVVRLYREVFCFRLDLLIHDKTVRLPGFRRTRTYPHCQFTGHVGPHGDSWICWQYACITHLPYG